MNKIGNILVFLTFVFLTLVVTNRYQLWNFDDGLIVSRIVDNIRSGNGWRYNIDESVNASTSVLHTILITFLAPLTKDIPFTAHVIGGVSILLASLTTYLLVGNLVGNLPAFFTALYLLFQMAQNSTWGLESHLFIAASLIFVLLENLKSNSWYWLGFATLTRPDGALFVGFKTLRELYEKRSISCLKGIFKTALIVAPWCIFSLFYFGQFFPDTLSNKVWQGQSGFWGNGHIYFKALLKHLILVPWWQWGIYIFSILGVIKLFFLRHALLYLIAFVTFQQIAYTFLNVPGYHWYFTLVDATIIISAGVGLGALIQPFLKRVDSYAQGAVSIYCIALIIWHLSNWSAASIRDPRDVAYERAIQTIESQNFPAGSLAALEVGTIGYHTKRKIIDLTGLTSANPELISGANIDTFFERSPEIVIFHSPPWHFERAVFDDIRFKVMYPASASLPDPNFPLEYYVKKEEITNLKELEAHARKTYKPFRSVTTIDPTKVIRDERILCAVDQVNGQMANKSELWSSRFSARFVGWTVDKGQKKLQPVEIQLLSDKGEWFTIEAQRVSRPDVATHLSNKDWDLAGFDITGTLVDLPPGRYQIHVAQKRGQQWTHCVPGLTLVLR